MAWTRNRPTGLLYRDPALAFDGYMLVPQDDEVRLYDADGSVAFTWRGASDCAYARLLPDGTLLQTIGGERMAPPKIANGEIVGIREVDASGRTLFEYRGERLHHDVWRLDDGSYHVLGFAPLSRELSARIRGGVPHADDPECIWGDTIEHIARDGTRRTVWSAEDHLDPDTHVICPIDPRKEWTHANSLRMTRDGHWLVSFRMSSTIVKIRRDSGEVVWAFGGGLTSHQHDARELDNGNVLIFDNGVHRVRSPSFARVVEIEPATNAIAWQYTAPTILAFQTFMAGGAQRLANGNTFITEAATGRLFQVTPKGETVWEWVNPVLLPSPFGPTPVIFRAHWYGRGDPRLPAALRAR